MVEEAHLARAPGGRVVRARHFFIELVPTDQVPAGEEFAAEIHISSEYVFRSPTIYLPYISQDRPEEPNTGVRRVGMTLGMSVRPPRTQS